MGKIVWSDDDNQLWLGDNRLVMTSEWATTGSPETTVIITDPPYNEGKNYEGWNDDLGMNIYAQVVSQWCEAFAVSAKFYCMLLPEKSDRQLIWLNALNTCYGKAAKIIAVTSTIPGQNWGGWTNQRRTLATNISPVTHAQKGLCPDVWTGILQLGWYGNSGRNRAASKHDGHTDYRIAGAIMDRLVYPSWTVLDPFVGHGTVLMEAKKRGLKGIGIDIGEKMLERAAQMLSQAVLIPHRIEPKRKRQQKLLNA